MYTAGFDYLAGKNIQRGLCITRNKIYMIKFYRNINNYARGKAICCELAIPLTPIGAPFSTGKASTAGRVTSVAAKADIENFMTGIVFNSCYGGKFAPGG